MNYHGVPIAATAATAGGVLAFTGSTLDIGWAIAGGLTAIFAGLALLKVVPKLRHRSGR